MDNSVCNFRIDILMLLVCSPNGLIARCTAARPPLKDVLRSISCRLNKWSLQCRCLYIVHVWTDHGRRVQVVVLQPLFYMSLLHISYNPCRATLSMLLLPLILTRQSHPLILPSSSRVFQLEARMLVTCCSTCRRLGSSLPL